MTNQTPTKAYHAQTGTIRSITWPAPSATSKGISYEVRANPADGRLSCNCLAGAHDKLCWHVKAAASGALGKPRVRYTPAPRPLSNVDSMRIINSLYGPAR